MDYYFGKLIIMVKLLILSILSLCTLFGVNRNGTTAANFLEIDVGSRGTGMGGAYVSVVNDVTSVFWNPAGLTGVTGNQVMFIYQPWVLDISHTFVGAAVKIPNTGVLAAHMVYMS